MIDRDPTGPRGLPHLRQLTHRPRRGDQLAGAPRILTQLTPGPRRHTRRVLSHVPLGLLEFREALGHRSLDRVTGLHQRAQFIGGRRRHRAHGVRRRAQCTDQLINPRIHTHILLCICSNVERFSLRSQHPVPRVT
ncbi:hypothetical protein [Aeromicrobium senzhongii]|uniref:hypothetical protein n=1 Tax=Aeromicrobium sp. 636 TaxID=2678500 RepID=UPI001CA92F22